MSPRAEIRTLDKQGLADFIQELKRQQYRHQIPFDAEFLAKYTEEARKVPKAKRKTAEVIYARYIDQCVAAWEAQQAKIVEDAKVPETPAEDSDGLLSAAESSLFAVQIAAAYGHRFSEFHSAPRAMWAPM